MYIYVASHNCKIVICGLTAGTPVEDAASIYQRMNSGYDVGTYIYKGLSK